MIWINERKYVGEPKISFTFYLPCNFTALFRRVSPIPLPLLDIIHASFQRILPFIFFFLFIHGHAPLRTYHALFSFPFIQVSIEASRLPSVLKIFRTDIQVIRTPPSILRERLPADQSYFTLYFLTIICESEFLRQDSFVSINAIARIYWVSILFSEVY